MSQTKTRNSRVARRITQRLLTKRRLHKSPGYGNKSGPTRIRKRMKRF